MERIKSFHKGRIWLNVFVDKDGEVALTIRKTFKGRDGQWKESPFLKPRFNDLMDLVQLLGEYMEFKEEQKTVRWFQ